MSLRDLDSISIPEQMQDLIEHVYDDSRSPDGETLPLRHAWEETRRALDRTREEHESQAKLAAILPPNYPGDILEDFSRDLAEDHPELHPSLQALTRLTDLTVPAVLLYPDESEGFDPKRTPDLDSVRWLLRRSLTIHHRGLARRLLEEPVPSGWRRSALLRHHRLVVLNDAGTAAPRGYMVYLDPDFGLRVIRAGSASEES